MSTTPDKAAAMRALAAANEVRMARANVKDAIHADPSWRALTDVVLGKRDAEAADRMRLRSLLTAAPGLGPRKARRLILEVGVSPMVSDAPLRALTPERRRALASVIRTTRKGLNGRGLRKIAERPRGGKPRKDTTT